MLSRVIGPECPDCGCPCGETIDERETKRGRMLRRECSHCHRAFWVVYESEAKPEPVAPPPPAQQDFIVVPFAIGPNGKPGATCTKCGTFPVRTTGHGRSREGQPKIRYHHCKCGAVLHSTEELATA